MEIDMNRDLERFKESVFMGLNVRQLLYSILSLAVGAVVVLLIYPYVGLTVSAYVAVPVVAPIALTGFYSYHGMTFMEKLKLKLQFMKRQPPLTYVSTEDATEIDRILDEEEAQARLSEKKKHKHHRKEGSDHGDV